MRRQEERAPDGAGQYTNGSGRLEGATVVVISGATGMGPGICAVLAREGAKLGVIDTSEDRLDRLTEKLGANVHCSVVHGDMSRQHEASALVDRVAEALDHIDVLVNNTGTFVPKTFLEHSPAEWDEVMAGTLTSTWASCRTVLPMMVERGRGAVINIASIAAWHYTHPHAAFTVAVAGVLALTRELAYEVGPLGIRVNAVAPGPIAAPMSTGRLSPDTLAGMLASVPLSRWGTPRDVGEAVAFLASPAATYLTGSTIVVAGGADLDVLRA